MKYSLESNWIGTSFELDVENSSNSLSKAPIFQFISDISLSVNRFLICSSSRKIEANVMEERSAQDKSLNMESNKKYFMLVRSFSPISGNNDLRLCKNTR